MVKREERNIIKEKISIKLHFHFCRSGSSHCVPAEIYAQAVPQCLSKSDLVEPALTGWDIATSHCNRRCSSSSLTPEDLSEQFDKYVSKSRFHPMADTKQRCSLHVIAQGHEQRQSSCEHSCTPPCTLTVLKGLALSCFTTDLHKASDTLLFK